MTDRDKELYRMALIYLICNFDDAIEAFDDDDLGPDQISMNGDLIAKPTEEEIANLLTSIC